MTTRTIDPARAWAPYRPDAERPWNLARVGHLLRRAAFGGTAKEQARLLELGPERAVDALLRPAGDLEAFARDYDAFEAAAGKPAELRAWWLRRMIETPHPLLERMTLLWHGHFATAPSGQQSGLSMRRYLALLRSEALGSFRRLAEGMTRDAALLTFLGAEKNRKAQPEERFARALLERYTVGSDSCTDDDVREAARAFAGAFVYDGKYRDVPREHDTGTKRVLGREGAHSGDDVVGIALEHPSTARRIVRALYRTFVAEDEEPAPALVDALAVPLRESGFDVAKTVETILRSNLFFSPAAYRRRVKSPVELAVGLVRAFEARVSTTRLATDLARLGQNLLHPPTASGWAGGARWIDRVTLMRRHDLAVALFAGAKPYGDALDPKGLAAKHGRSGAPDAGRFLVELFVQDDLEPAVRDALRPDAAAASDLRGLAHSLAVLPEYQLS